MAELNPSSRSSGSDDDDKVRPMVSKGEEQAQNNQHQQKKTSKASTAESPPNNAIPRDEASCPSWLIQIWSEVEVRESNQSQGPKIAKVKESPKISKVEEHLKSKNEKCYNPLVVSIGPYHRLDRVNKLKTGESLKAPMTYKFIKDSGKGREKFYSEVEKVAKEARGFYDKSSMEDINDADFTKMMFIDGCFVLQFIHCVTSDNEKLKDGDKFYEELKNLSDQQIADVKRDFLLLENQLPFPVLKSLMNLRYGKDKGIERIQKFLPIRDGRQHFSTISLILLGLLICMLYICCCFCCCFRAQPSTPSPIKKKEASRDDQSPDKQPAVGDDKQPSQKYAHLLEYLYLRFTDSLEGKYSKLISAKPKRSLGTRGHHLYYSAKDLKKVGIHFRANVTGALTDVKLNSKYFYGTLKLPPIAIDKSTESMLFNLLAYESAFQVEKNLISSYIHFMDSLIDDAEDVKELRSKGILFNYLGPDKDVADLFSLMNKSLEPETLSYYNDVKRNINKQCESTIKKWVADWQHDYFSSPWAFIAFVAAAFTIFLTAVATYVAVWPIK